MASPHETTTVAPDTTPVEQDRQRGATLTGYALTLSLIAGLALSSIAFLQNSGETFLVESGDNIGDARVSASVAAVDQLDGIPTDGNSIGPGVPPG